MIVHCENFPEDLDDGVRTACDDAKNRILDSSAMLDASLQPLRWNARQFVFGIRHPDVCDMLCPDCVAHVRELVRDEEIAKAGKSQEFRFAVGPETSSGAVPPRAVEVQLTAAALDAAEPRSKQIASWLEVECPTCKIAPRRYCLGGPDVIHESRLIAAEAQRANMRRDEILDRLHRYNIERFEASWLNQYRDERRRRLKVVMALSIELQKMLETTNFSTRLCELAIEAVIDGDWAVVRDWADHFTFLSEGEDLRTKFAPVFSTFRELLLQALRGGKNEAS